LRETTFSWKLSSVPFLNGCKLLKRTNDYWQSKLILVTIVKPYFRVVDPQALTQERWAFAPLEAVEDFHVAHDALKTFEPLVERFLVNGKITSRSTPLKDCQEIKA
jgi:hypothetical protein